MPGEQIAELTQRSGYIETLIRQGFSGENPGERARGIGLACQQHFRAALFHVAHEAIARTSRHHDVDAIQRVRAIVFTVMDHLMFRQFDALRLRLRQRTRQRRLPKIVDEPATGDVRRGQLRRGPTFRFCRG